jgi:hypothetical protein
MPGDGVESQNITIGKGTTMRRFISSLGTAALLVGLVGGGGASGASPNAESTFVYSEPLEFTLAAGVCPDLPADLTVAFTGVVRGHVHVSVDAAGVIHVNWPDTIYGTAIDSDGNDYRFDYHNVAVIRDAGFPIEITITDHFNLVGNGPANQLHTVVVLRLVISGEGEEEVVFNAHGAPECDAL